jgi:cytochrome c oxidase subunit II
MEGNHAMDVRERRWLYLLIAVFLVFNIITLSPLIPWQKWLLWGDPTPSKSFSINIAGYRMQLPAGGMTVKAGEYVEFVATSQDVTYGFGVFRPDSTLVFQMQVLPGHTNRILWKFDAPGMYDVRSTEYSGPRHSEMYYKNAISVTQ